ncbi:MAG: NAD(P)H-binding protein [Lutibacter sp.]|nr:NAD(P)H-binding protein [Lutibacter sp.]
MKKTAIIIGASGLTGNLLLKKLIDDDRYKTIKLFSRTKLNGLPSKVQQFIGNILELESFKEDFIADEVFVCIGTTTKKTPNKAIYKSIDFGIPTAAAKLSKENNITTFIVVSAMGANSKSTVFYNKTKGEMEQAVLEQNISNTYILRPSIISGKRNENRTLERIGIAFFKFIKPLMIGKLKEYQIIEAETIAKAMVNLANYKTKTIITSDKIKTLATIN